MSDPAKDILNMERAAKRALAKGENLTPKAKKELEEALVMAKAWRMAKAGEAKATKKPN